MRTNDVAVWNSQGGEAIQAYATTVAKQLGLTLGDYPFGTATNLPAMGQPPYKLVVSIKRPFTTDREFFFTYDEIRGYAHDTSKATVQARIRDDLERLRRLYEEEPPAA
jgi:hypothetical protein